MTPATTVALVCVTHDSEELLPAFSTATRAGLHSVAGARIVVVDSGSRDATVALARALLPEAEVVRLNGNRGYAAGINAGVAHVQRLGGANAFVVVNPDVLLGRDTVPLLVEALHLRGSGLAVPRLRDEHGALLPSLRRQPSSITTWSEALLGGPLAAKLRLPTEVLWDGAAYARDRDAAWATGGIMAITAECMETVGPWDESFFLYEEEVDFALRAGDAGYRLSYVAAAVATRTIGPRRAPPWAQALMHANRVRLMRRRGPGRRAALVRAGLLVGSGLRCALRRPEAAASVWAVWHGASPEQILARYRPDARPVIASPATREMGRCWNPGGNPRTQTEATSRSNSEPPPSPSARASASGGSSKDSGR